MRRSQSRTDRQERHTLEKAEEVSRANTCSKDTAVKEIFMRLLMEVRKKIFPINWTYLFFLSVEKCIDGISSCFHTLLMFSLRDLFFSSEWSVSPCMPLNFLLSRHWRLCRANAGQNTLILYIAFRSGRSTSVSWEHKTNQSDFYSGCWFCMHTVPSISLQVFRGQRANLEGTLDI